MSTPTVGRIVHITLDDGQVRPAMIVRVWSDKCVNLRAVSDGENDDDRTFGGRILPDDGWLTSIECSDVHSPGKWTWPPRTP